MSDLFTTTLAGQNDGLEIAFGPENLKTILKKMKFSWGNEKIVCLSVLILKERSFLLDMDFWKSRKNSF